MKTLAMGWFLRRKELLQAIGIQGFLLPPFQCVQRRLLSLSLPEGLEAVGDEPDQGELELVPEEATPGSRSPEGALFCGGTIPWLKSSSIRPPA